MIWKKNFVKKIPYFDSICLLNELNSIFEAILAVLLVGHWEEKSASISSDQRRYELNLNQIK